MFCSGSGRDLAELQHLLAHKRSAGARLEEPRRWPSPRSRVDRVTAPDARPTGALVRRSPTALHEHGPAGAALPERTICESGATGRVSEFSLRLAERERRGSSTSSSPARTCVRVATSANSSGRDELTAVLLLRQELEHVGMRRPDW